MTESLIIIRRAGIGDAESIAQLFGNTINYVNSKDYSKREIEVWSSFAKDIDQWRSTIQEQHFLVAEINNTIVGFSSITVNGYLDLMYTHYAFQRKGIASLLLKEIETTARSLEVEEIDVLVSKTAVPFFTSKGYMSIEKISKTIDGVEFINDKMIKNLQRGH